MTTNPSMPEVIMVEPNTLNAAFIEDFNAEIERNRTDLSSWQPYRKESSLVEMKTVLADCLNSLLTAQFKYRGTYGRTVNELANMETPYDTTILSAEQILNKK